PTASCSPATSGSSPAATATTGSSRPGHSASTMPKCCATSRSRAGGLALLPDFIAADALRKGELRTVLDDYSAPPLALYAVYPPTRHLSVKVRLFIDFLVERFGGSSG
ncbi:hypothetical protein KMY60_27835, partial [Klebsiella pneumoniae]|uniref:LysR substrate-binding domain-containing protein n=1 Tax=Klebsiella pneumoniae TaxID=573 RepID=UPI0020030257